MPRFRKIAKEIEAEQYVEYGRLVKGMCNSMSCYQAGNNQPHVHTIHKDQLVNLEVGDWVIPEPDGEHFYPCKDDIFNTTYESAATPPVAAEAVVASFAASDEPEPIAALRELFNMVNYALDSRDALLISKTSATMLRAEAVLESPVTAVPAKCDECGHTLPHPFTSEQGEKE